MNEIKFDDFGANLILKFKPLKTLFNICNFICNFQIEKITLMFVLVWPLL